MDKYPGSVFCPFCGKLCVCFDATETHGNVECGMCKAKLEVKHSNLGDDKAAWTIKGVSGSCFS
jgi:transcription elongation factor Elf1